METVETNTTEAPEIHYRDFQIESGNTEAKTVEMSVSSEAPVSSSRDLDASSAKRILVGGGVGFLFLNALTINNGIIKAEELGELATPLPIIVVWALVTVWMLTAGLRKDQS